MVRKGGRENRDAENGAIDLKRGRLGTCCVAFGRCEGESGRLFLVHRRSEIIPDTQLTWYYILSALGVRPAVLVASSVDEEGVAAEVRSSSEQNTLARRVLPRA